jgi:GNAT superfamily N-acetyltransferase
MARVHVASWKTTYAGIVPQSYLDALNVADREARWRAGLETGGTIALVAEDETGIFGFVDGGALRMPIGDYDGEMYAIYLLAERQKQGVGSALLRELAERLRDAGYRTMAVWALEQNPACRFYERMGAVRIAEQTVEIGGLTLPEVALGWSDITALCGPARRLRS